MNNKLQRSEYFTLDGLAFQVSGDALEQRISIGVAMNVVRGYCAGMNRGDECDRALVYLEENVGKINLFVRALRDTYHLDDFNDQEEKMARCGPALRGIWSRVNNRNV